MFSATRWAVLAFAVLPAFLATGCDDRPAAGPMVTARTVYGRQEFRELVMGKTPDEVIAVVGKPDSTQDSGSDLIWYYRDRTSDPVAEKLDYHAQVIFKDGRVAKVNY